MLRLPSWTLEKERFASCFEGLAGQMDGGWRYWVALVVERGNIGSDFRWQKWLGRELSSYCSVSLVVVRGRAKRNE